MRGRSSLLAPLALALLLVAPTTTAQSPAHENFARAQTDVAALESLATTLLNLTERALQATIAEQDANATRGARLLLALTQDLALIASLSEVESATLLAPYVGPYSRIASNATNVTTQISALRALPPAARGPYVLLARDSILGMYADADAFEALGHDVAPLRDLLARILDMLEGIQIEADKIAPPPPQPYLLLVVEPDEIPLGRDLTARAVLVAPRPQPGVEVRLALDGAPWRIATTDENGAARVRQRLALDARLGGHEIVAEASLAGETLIGHAQFNVTLIPTTLTFHAAQLRTPEGVGLVLRGRLTDDEREPIPGAIAQLAIGNDTPREISFLSDGSVALQLAPDELREGTYEATLRYAGDERHEAASATARWDVRVGTPSPSTPASGEAEDGDGEPAPPIIFIPGTTVVEDVVATAREAPPALLWPLAILLVLAAEIATRNALERRPDLLVGKPLRARIRETIARFTPVRRRAVNDPRDVVLAAYNDLLLTLARDGVRVDTLTHREVARELSRRIDDAAAIEEVTQVFERVRYARETPTSPMLAGYLPKVVRLVRERGG